MESRYLTPVNRGRGTARTQKRLSTGNQRERAKTGGEIDSLPENGRAGYVATKMLIKKRGGEQGQKSGLTHTRKSGKRRLKEKLKKEGHRFGRARTRTAEDKRGFVRHRECQMRKENFSNVNRKPKKSLLSMEQNRSPSKRLEGQAPDGHRTVELRPWGS